MTDLEHRLRRDLRKFSERVRPESLQPLPVQPHPGSARVRRWLAPTAAMGAVLCVIAGVWITGQRDLSSLPAPAAPALGMPRYYVAVFQSYGNSGKIATVAVVHESATGAALSRVTVPTLLAGGAAQGPMITAAANDRTFIITQTDDSQPFIRYARFYLLHVSANGRVASLSNLRIRVPATFGINDAELSPDGRRLAIAGQSCVQARCAGGYAAIRIVTLATGAVKTWTTRAQGSPGNLSWTRDGQQVAFFWASEVGKGYRLLDLTGPGGNLLAARPIGSPKAVATGYTPAAFITPDGKGVITSSVRNIPSGPGQDTVVARIIELSASTGRLLRVLYTTVAYNASTGGNGAAANLDQSCNVVSVGLKGLNALVSCFAFGRVGTDGFAALAGFPSPSSSGITQQSTAAW